MQALLGMGLLHALPAYRFSGLYITVHHLRQRRAQLIIPGYFNSHS